MSVVDVLGQIERINRGDVAAAAEFGPSELGPRGVVVTELLCVDGATRIAPSNQVREFYGYALWWRLDVGTVMAEPSVRDLIDGDFRRNNNREAPVDRAYLVFGNTPEPRVVYAGSEVSVFEDMHAYLESWRRTLA